MSEEHGAEREERRLADLFAAVQPPETLGTGWPVAGPAPRRAGRLVGRLLVGAPGERRLRPLVAALIMPVLVLAAAGGVGLQAHFAGSGAGGANPQARADAAMAFDAARGDVVMFGGRGLSGFLDDTWTWGGSGWTQQHPSVSPPAMQALAMAADPSTGRVLLVGVPRGNQASRPGEQTWSWDGSTWRQEHPSHQVPSVVPGGMASDAAHHQVVAMVQPPPAMVPRPQPASTPAPGAGVPVQVTPLIAQLPPAETWTWNGSDWIRHAGSTAARAGGFRLAWEQQAHSVVMLVEASMCVFVQGGDTLQGGDTVIGTLPSAPPPGPAPTPMSGGAAVSGPAIAVPVATPHARPISPTPGALPPNVEPVSPPSVIPVPACAEAGSATTHGGLGTPSYSCASCASARLSTWDGSAWHTVTTTGMMPPVSIGDTADDPSSGGVLLVAGGRTWTVTGSSVHSASLPREVMRSQAAMAGDPAHHEVVLFGGLGMAGMGGDTWTWDGQAWTHRAGEVAPLLSPDGMMPPPMPVQVAPPMQTAIAQPACGLAHGSFGAAHGAVPGASSLTYSIPWPSDCPVTVILVDGAGKPLDVKGNDVTLTPEGELRFTWSNWCGSGPVQLKLAQKNASSLQSTTAPGCRDRSAPSILSFQVSSAVP